MASWINRTTGVAARNGTTSHSIAFTAATSGNLLVMVVAGGVTTTSTGWTKQATAVNATEVAVFTRPATAGLAAATLTHNGSNYPVGWIVYEFPAGSTYAAGTQASNITHTVTTGPTLTGLTGTNTIFGFNSMAVTAGDGQNTYTWSIPATKDLDVYTASSGTDGVALSGAYTDGYTSASYVITVADNNVSARADERIAFAIKVATTTRAPQNGWGINL